MSLLLVSRSFTEVVTGIFIEMMVSNSDLYKACGIFPRTLFLMGKITWKLVLVGS